ncbi:hypothetical protein C8R46DRAFT_397607 [Mycena filopes]|nr:hypothetical protein C8R46DRAFT_397607 [Mycena filopes]
MPPTIAAAPQTSPPAPAPSSLAPALTSLSLHEPPLSQQTTNGTLKPLLSFFNRFLETARAETQLEKTQKKRVSRKSQRRNPAPQPIGALKSFLRNSCPPEVLRPIPRTVFPLSPFVVFARCSRALLRHAIPRSRCSSCHSGNAIPGRASLHSTYLRSSNAIPNRDGLLTTMI